MKRLVSKLVALAFIALGLVGCDEVKSLFSSIEEPLVGIEMDDKFNLVLFIQSQDNETIIESVKLNRGNCGVAIYETSERTLLNYARDNRDRVVFLGNSLSIDARIDFVSNGQAVSMDGMASLKFGENGLEFNHGKIKFQVFSNDLSPYQNLDEASKSAFVSLYPKKLPYGEKFSPSINCNADKIIEVELVTNGGTFTYNLEQGGIR